MKNTIKAICVIIGAIIGAGFASGREIYIFFTRYGIKGILGIVIATAITGVLIYKVLLRIRNQSVNSYHQYLETITTNSKMKDIASYIINLFLLISFYIMIAGFCTYFNQEFNLPKILVSSILCGICYVTFMGNIERVTKVNSIIIPFLIIMIIIIGAKSSFLTQNCLLAEATETRFEKINSMFEAHSAIQQSSVGWIIASLEYASYNSILLVPMLISLKKYTYKKEKSIAISVSTILFVLAIIVFAILLGGEAEIQAVEMPLTYVAKQLGVAYQHMYGVAIITAIFTSAIAAGYGFIENCSKNQKNYKKIALAICMSAIFISHIGFASLVDLLYPVLGILGLIHISFILLN